MKRREHVYKVMYRLEVHGVQTDWQLLVLKPLYSASIMAPDALRAIHWRMSDIAEALGKIESDVCRVVEFKVVEITVEAALEEHRRICEECKDESNCFAGKQLHKESVNRTWT